MSFSFNIKDEISRVEANRMEMISELSGIVRNSSLKGEGIQLVIENNGVARRIFSLFKQMYGVSASITVRRRYGYSNHLSYILSIHHKYEDILRDLSIMDANGEYLDIPSDFVVSDDDVARAYLRGVFMVSGSVNDPKTSRYHLELVLDSGSYADFIKELLNGYDLNSKVIKREKNYMVYIKEAEKISDFLRLIRAYSGVMYYEDIRIYRDHKNMTNRLNNCEQANMDKVFLTANRQIADINKIQRNDMFDMMDDKLVEVMEYRLKYPEYSLQELACVMSEELGKSITKSGLNHRFRKIKEIASNIQK